MARLYPLFPFFKRMLHIHGSHHPVFGGAHRKLHHPDPPADGFHVPAGQNNIPTAFPGAFRAHVVFFIRRLLERASGRHRDFRQDIGQGADRRGFGRAFFSTDENAGKGRVDNV